MEKICPICDGSGQLSTFKGVSRFLLSWEECPECDGLGYVIADKKIDGAKRGNSGLAGKSLGETGSDHGG